MEWQPIETMPKDIKILLFWPASINVRTHEDIIATACSEFDELDPCDIDNWTAGKLLDYTPPRYPTHWMPLPNPPVDTPTTIS